MPTARKVRSSTASATRAEAQELTRRRLADAAFAEFEESGYARTTVEDVARRAGTSRATFYAHFGGKANLVEAMWEVTCRDLVRLHRELVATPVRDRAYVEAWLLQTYEFYSANRARLLAVHEAIALEEHVAEAYGLRTGQVVDLVAPAVAATRGVSLAEARARALLLIMQHERFCYFSLLRRLDMESEAARAVLAAAWCSELGAGS